MKCPKCFYNQKHSYGMKCYKCGYQFVTDPKSVNPMNDYRFSMIIKKASSNETEFFTFNQLYATYLRRISLFDKLAHTVLSTLVISAIVFFIIYKGAELGLAASLALAAVAGGLNGFLNHKKEISYEGFLNIFNKWVKYNEFPYYYLEENLLIEAPEESPEDDIFNYGVEGILITDQNRYVDLFIQNEYHMQFRILIISKSGYPEYLIDETNDLLKRNNQVPVYFLHDATTEGVNLMNDVIAESKFRFRDQPLIDIGLFPEDFKKIKMLRRFKKLISENFAPLDLLSSGKLKLLLTHCIEHKKPLSEIVDFQHGNRIWDEMDMDFG